MKSPIPTGHADYVSWVDELKICIRDARVRAALAIKSELVGLYRRIGRNILERQAQEGWGSNTNGLSVAQIHSFVAVFLIS